MSDLKSELEKIVSGEVDASAKSRDFYSNDASMFELRPDVIISPKDSSDSQKIVKYVSENKGKNPKLSITPRSAGTDMTGGAINDSIILDMTKHFNQIIEVSSKSAHVQPGVYYRDFEKATLEHNALMPSFPASRQLCTVGGMVANNSGGEKSLEFGKTEKFVQELKVILSDGKEYEIKPLSKKELDEKMKKRTFEGKLYKQLFKLLEENNKEIKAAKPKVSKDSTGYHLWNVWDPKKKIFDLTQLIVGSQGTLGIVTDIKFKLVKNPKESGSLIIFLNHLDNLGEVINKVLEHKPATFEGFDNYTLKLSFKLFFDFRKTIGLKQTIKLGLQLVPSLINFRRGIPKMVLIAQFTADTDEEIVKKVRDLHWDMAEFGHDALFEEDETEQDEMKFQIMRRESFNLLRKKVHDKHTAPFIDDLVVPPKYLPEFLPQLREIIDRYELVATVAGHMGDGNFHVIPLMKIELESERAKLEPAMREVNELVLSYGGSMSGEHNDGMTRGPWLDQQYSENIMSHFREVKNIFDPKNIFNPHKKTDSDWQFSMDHIREHF
ncbi:FAD-binding oxidoreductase [Candidatus Saccharibacteria bacterium]|nr:FAD-binding oxidoreductase [Candidatus Saccharibacteria bacterium]